MTATAKVTSIDLVTKTASITITGHAPAPQAEIEEVATLLSGRPEAAPLVASLYSVNETVVVPFLDGAVDLETFRSWVESKIRAQTTIAGYTWQAVKAMVPIMPDLTGVFDLEVTEPQAETQGVLAFDEDQV